MTNYKEEQQTELEALESIYYDSFEIISEDPHQFSLTVKGENEDEEDLTVTLEFTYTPKYPDEAPIYEVKDVGGLEETAEDEILEIIKKEVEENLGVVMVFTVVSAIQEYIHDFKEEQKRRAEEEKERREKELEEAEKKRFHGTPVTVETFLIWKQKFDDDMQVAKMQEKKEEAKKKLTGKELFLSDKNILENELLEGENEAVAVDESLFEDLDDLDLDDLDDDPDFDPNDFS